MVEKIIETDDYKELLNRQKKLCDEFGIDFEKVPDLNQKIFALGKVSKDALDKCIIPSFINVQKNSGYWTEIWTLSHDTKKGLSPKQKSLLGLFLYLSLAEGMVSENVQIISFLLILNGHDLYDPRGMEFIDSYRKLDKIDLFVKMQFLERHGFTFITRAIDRNLRNCIAHLEYTVNEDGTIINQKSGEKIQDIDKKLHHLGCPNTIVTMAISHLVKHYKVL